MRILMGVHYEGMTSCERVEKSDMLKINVSKAWMIPWALTPCGKKPELNGGRLDPAKTNIKILLKLVKEATNFPISRKLLIFTIVEMI